MTNHGVRSLLRHRHAPAIILRSYSPPSIPPPATICKAISSFAGAPRVAGRKFEETVPASLLHHFSLSTLPDRERLVEKDVKSRNEELVKLDEEETGLVGQRMEELVTKRYVDVKSGNERLAKIDEEETVRQKIEELVNTNKKLAEEVRSTRLSMQGCIFGGFIGTLIALLIHVLR